MDIHTGNIDNWPTGSQKYSLHINDGVIQSLLLGTQQLLAKELKEYMDIRITEYKYVLKEASAIMLYIKFLR